MADRCRNGFSSPQVPALMRLLPFLLVWVTLAAAGPTPAGDWPCFRGPGGSGGSDDAAVPTRWGEAENLQWKAALPGPGSSSPIVHGDRVFVTCYSGYGTGRDGGGRV